MSVNISGTGTQVILRASSTFPIGLPLSQFADDADSIDIPSLVINENGMGLNGDLITWSKANPLMVTLNMIPNSGDDENLGTLLNANRVARGKTSAQDEITLVIIYGNGVSIATYTGGVISEGMPSLGIASSQRFKTKAYKFTFENVTVLNNPL